MNGGADSSRVFAMSAIEGLRALRLRRLANPNLGPADLAALLRGVDPEGSSHDYEAAFHLDTIVAHSAPAAEPEVATP